MFRMRVKFLKQKRTGNLPKKQEGWILIPILMGLM